MADTNATGPYIPPNLYNTPIPDLLTLIAQQNPIHPLAQVIQEHSDGSTDSIIFTWAETIQHAQHASAALTHSWCCQPREAGTSPVVVGLLANNKYDLYVNIIACLLNRWTALLISPKNSSPAVEHLLRISNSSLLILEPTNMTFGRQMEQKIPGLRSQALVTLDTFSSKPSSSPLLALERTQVAREMSLPAFFLHTSGSTGHPKLVPWSHEFVLSGMRGRTRDRSEWKGLPVYSVPPIIHAAGMIVYFMYTPAHGHLLTFVSSPTVRPPSATSVLAHLPFYNDGILILPPSILEDICNLGPEAMNSVAEKTRLVSYTGAPLKTSIGDALVAAGIRLQARYGSTEINFASTHLSERRPEDWEYVEFREGYSWYFLPVDNSDLRELIVGPGTDGCPAVINNDMPYGFVTNDIWQPHPILRNFWRHHSRKGDVTVLSNGEKSDNKQIENLLLRDKRIRYIQVFGAGRPMNGVLIQPTDFSVPISQFLAQIEPTLQYANSILPNHSRLVPELVIVARANQPFPLTDKDTVKRNETLDMFHKEIESAYNILEEGGSAKEWVFEGNVRDEHAIKKFVRYIVHTVLGKPVSDDDDLFEQGLDSLLSIRLRSALLSVAKETSASLPISRNVIYDYPSISALTKFLLSRPTATDLRESVERRIRTSIAKYSANFIPHKPGPRVVSGKIIALSGSTGSVGSSILSLLLQREDVKKIYLLNRSRKQSQEIRQVNGFREKGLDPTILERKRGRIVYLDVDFSKKDLGLVERDYRNLQNDATHIIHVAWQLNFNFILESYESTHIAGVRHLIDLALSSPQARPPWLTFLSSIGAAAMYAGPSEEPSVGERGGQCIVPEAPVNDPSMALNQGYGQSKYVSERVIVNAIDMGLRATIVRVGQLSGSTINGAWPKNEYVPILLRSILALGLVPENLPPFRWIPSDIAASALIKQAFIDTCNPGYFSVENPFPTPWEVVVDALSTVAPRLLRPVPPMKWLDHIKETNPDPGDVPAMKLFDFFTKRFESRAISAALGWEKSVEVAPELAMGPISVELVQKYILYQQSEGEPKRQDA